MDPEATLQFRPDADLDEVIVTYLKAAQAGAAPTPDEVIARYPSFAAELAQFFADQERLQRLAEAIRSAVAPAAGTKVRYFGDYELLEEIARGAMGVVYRARQESLHREVALKMILAGQLAAPEDVQRFYREAQAAGNLDHPNIVPIYEVNEQDNQHYFSMKLIEGGSLASRARPMPGRQAARLIAVVARAVHHAHQRGILHRDLKPGNILFDTQDTPYVTDFGLARRVEGDVHHTRTGGIVGTPAYMAPEQARSEKVLTTAVDVYGLGAVLYDLLTGRSPFRAATVIDTILQVLDREPEPPSRLNPQVDRDLQTICLKCLDKDPARRYGSAEALAEDLERWLAGEPIRARPAGRVERVVKWTRRNPVLAAMAAAVVVVLIAGTVISSCLAIYAQHKAELATRNEGDAIDARNQLEAALVGEKEQKQKAVDALAVNERVLTGIRIGQANAALKDHDPVRAMELLETCAPSARFWEWHYTHRLCRGAPLTLHYDGLYHFRSAAFSPDGRWIVATTDNAVALYDAATGAEQWSRDGRARLATFSPDSRRIVAWVDDGQTAGLRFWDIAAAREPKEMPSISMKPCKVPYGQRQGELVFSPDGKWLAFGTWGTVVVTVWDAHTRDKQFSHAAPAEGGFTRAGLAFAPDSSSLAVHDGEAVRFLDPRTGKEQRRFAARGLTAGFSPDFRRLVVNATISDAKELHLFDLASGKQLRKIPLPEEMSGGVVDVTFRPDGQQLACVDYTYRGLVRLIDVGSGKVVGTLPHDMKRFQVEAARVFGLSFSPDGQRLLVCSLSAVEVWNARDWNGPTTLRGHTEGVLDLAFAPDGGELLTVANILQPTGRTGVPIAWVRALGMGGGFHVYDDGFSGLTTFGGDGFSSNMGGYGRFGQTGAFATPRYNGPCWEMKRWNVDGGYAVATWQGHGAPLNCAAFSPKTHRVAVGGQDRTIRICDTRTGRELLSVGLAEPVDTLVFGPDGNFLVALVPKLRQILVLDAASGQVRRVIAPPTFIGAIALSPDGRSVAGTTGERTAGMGAGTMWFLDQVHVWSLETGAERTVLTSPAGQSLSMCLAYSPDGSRLAVGTGDDMVTIFDARTGQPQLDLKGGASWIAFSADGERLATAANGPVVKVWDLRTREEVYSFPCGSWGSCRVVFRSDNAALAAASASPAGGYIPAVLVLSADPPARRAYLEGSPTSATFSPDGRHIAASRLERDILLYDAFTGQTLRRLKGHARLIGAFDFSDDGKRLVSCSRAGMTDTHLLSAELIVWDVETAKPLAVFDDIPDKDLGTVALSSDGTQVAANFHVWANGQLHGRVIQVWDVATRQLRHTIPTADSAGWLKFVDNDTVIVTRSVQGKVVGWSLATGQPVNVAGDPFAARTDGSRTADGRRLRPFRATYVIEAAPDDTQRRRLTAQAQPDSAWHDEAARRAEAAKDWFAAEFHLGRLLLQPAGSAELLCRHARAAAALKRWDAALADCDKAIGTWPQSVEARLTRGLLEAARGRMEQAHADLAHAAGLAPDDPAVAVARALVFTVDQKPEQGAAAEKTALERLEVLNPLSRQQMPRWPNTQVATAAQAPLVWPQSSWPALEDALTAKLQNTKTTPLLRLRGMVRAVQGELNGALDDFQEAVKLAPDDALAWKGIAAALYRGVSTQPVKDLAYALDRALKLDPAAWDIWCARANLDIQEGRKQAAIEAYTKGLALHPNYELGYRVRGWLHAEAGHWDKAVLDFARAAELTGASDPTPWDALALAQLGHGDAAAYQQTCKRMLALFGRTPPLIWAGGAFAVGPFNPYAAPLTLHVAEHAASLSQHAAAVTAFRCTTRPDTRVDWQQLMRLTEKSREIRGAVLCRAGQYEEAVKLLTPARAAYGPLATLYLALAEHGRGRTAEARRLLQETPSRLGLPANNGEPSRDAFTWTERVQIEQLRRELDALLK